MVLADIGDSVQRMTDTVFAWAPKLVGALLIFIIGYFVAKIVGRLVGRALHGAGADRALHRGAIGEQVNRFAPDMKPSDVIGTIAFWFIFGSAILLAVSALGIDALENAIASAVGYLPNVIAALLIVLVAGALAGAVGGVAQRLMGGTMLGKIVSTAVPTLIMVIALFMALDQLRIAEDIVLATYVLTLGALALGFALAFGLGGRDVAREMLMGAYQSGREAMPQMRQEAQQAREQAAADARRLKEQAESASQSSTAETQVARPVGPGSTTY